MNTLRAYMRIAVGAAVVTTQTGCLDLDEEIVTGVTTSYYQDAAGLEDAVDATYAVLRTFYGTEPGMTISEAGTDLWWRGAVGGQFADYTAGLNSNDSWLTGIWNDLYRGINIANIVVSRVDEVELPAQLRDQRVAEVRYLRALYYFLLVQLFGGVHLTLEETVGVTTETPRAPAEEVYDAIVADLEFAAVHLPATPDEWGRATSGAVQHLLAKVHLTRAAPGDMTRAAELAQQIINSGVYSLRPRFVDVFDVLDQEHEEVIFPVRYSWSLRSNAPASMYHMYFAGGYTSFPGLQRSLEYGRTFSRARPSRFVLLGLWDHETDIDSRYDSFRTMWLANDASTLPMDSQGNPLFEVGDTALWIPIDASQELIDSKPYAVEPLSQYHPGSRAFPNLIKYDDHTRREPNDRETQKDVIVSRLAETYLIAAEALLRDGRPGEAVPYVNAIRRRAARPGFEAQMEITAAELDMDFILDERARELAGELVRWFDLVRTGTLLDRVRAHNEGAAPNIQPHHVLRPIPQSAIDRTTSEFPQNPGY